LVTNFKYSNFMDKFNFSLNANLTADKRWKLKYLLLVLVRFNRLLPS
jgi:hypothetical protein